MRGGSRERDGERETCLQTRECNYESQDLDLFLKTGKKKDLRNKRLVKLENKTKSIYGS